MVLLVAFNIVSINVEINGYYLVRGVRVRAGSDGIYGWVVGEVIIGYIRKIPRVRGGDRAGYGTVPDPGSVMRWRSWIIDLAGSLGVQVGAGPEGAGRVVPPMERG